MKSFKTCLKHKQGHPELHEFPALVKRGDSFIELALATLSSLLSVADVTSATSENGESTLKYLFSRFYSLLLLKSDSLQAMHRGPSGKTPYSTTLHYSSCLRRNWPILIAWD